jgi:Tol biopolymer transport system component
VVVQSLSTGKRTTVIENATDARYLPGGHLVYAARDGVFAVSFDAGRAAVDGPPVASIAGVRRSSGRGTGAVHFSVSDTGTLVYVPGALSRMTTGYKEILVADREGHKQKLPLPAGLYNEMRVSPDGRQVAVSVDEPDAESIYLFERSGATGLRRLTFGGNNRAPIWASDGRHVVFQSDRGGDAAIYWQRADGSEPAERLTTPAKGEAHFPESWRPDGSGFLYTVVRRDEHTLWFHSIEGGRAAAYGEIRSLQPVDASFSPDGNWVAYSTKDPESGERGIFVQPFPATGAVYPLFVGTRAGAPSNANHKPAWSSDGRELFYVPRLGDFEVVPVNTHPFSFGKARLVPRKFLPGPPDLRRVYDVTPDGQFVASYPVDPSYAEEFDNSKLQVVLHWVD